MFKHSHIWNIEQGGGITPREGRIVIDCDDMPLDADDAKRALVVASGLQPRDFAVFASHIGTSVLHEQHAGFVVTDVQPDGSGVLVHGDKILENPKNWLSPRAIDIWKYLDLESPGIFEEFGLQALRSHIYKPY